MDWTLWEENGNTRLIPNSDDAQEDSSYPPEDNSIGQHPLDSTNHWYNYAEIDDQSPFPPWSSLFPYHDASDQMDVSIVPGIDPGFSLRHDILPPTPAYSYPSPSSLERPVTDSMAVNAGIELDMNFDSASVLDKCNNTNEQDQRHISKGQLEIQKNFIKCPFESCGKTYNRASELSRHKAEKHYSQAFVWVCGHSDDKPTGGTCGQNGAYTAVRKQHIKQHILKTHKREISNLSVCTRDGCYIEGRSRGLVFASVESLQEHTARAHPLNAQVDTTAHYDGVSLRFCQHCSMGRDATLDSKESSVVAQHPSPAAKHPLTSLESPLVKRRKLEENRCYSCGNELSIMNEKHSKSQCSSAMDVASSGMIQTSPLLDIPAIAGHEIDQSTVEISDVKPAEFVAISREADIIRIDENLNPITASTEDCATAKNRDETSSFVFILSRKSIQLRGPAVVILAAKVRIENILAKVKRYTRGEFGEKRTSLKYSDDLLETPSSQPRARQHTEVFPLRVEEDSHYIHIWKFFILPRLPQILTELLGRDYSAALVRQGISDQTSSIVIRIQSQKYYARLWPQVREAIAEIFKSLGELPVKTYFSSGKLTLLAGEGSDDPSNEDGEVQVLPHHRRWWKYAGMGASLGLRCNKRVSGTLGGYILLDGKRYLLTADHFIERARRALGPSAIEDGSSYEIMSPSSHDIQDILSCLQANLKEISLALELELKERGQDKLKPAEVQGSDASQKEQRNWNDQLQKWANELDQEDEHFVLGEVKQRCGGGPVEVMCNGKLVSRKMDWALCSISNKRKGENRHRYRSKLTPESTAYKRDGVHPKGAGDECTQTCPVQAGAQVHYVGAGTGYQSAKINPSEVLVSSGGLITVEWSLIPADRSHNHHRGDSGAWIIQDRGQLLAGMLWGEQDSLLYFTPIGEIFDNIKEDMGADLVCLPPSANNTPRGFNEVTHICRDEEKPTRSQKYKSPFTPPQRLPLNMAPLEIPCSVNKELPFSNISSKIAQPSTRLEDVAAGRLKPQSSSVRSPSPVPSLVSSETTLSESSLDCPSPISPELPSLHDERTSWASEVISKTYDIQTKKRSLESILESIKLDPEDGSRPLLSHLNSQPWSRYSNHRLI